MTGTPLLATDPRRIGPYSLLARLGQGGMGVVFLAADDARRPVALKVIRPELTHDAHLRARFRREAEAASRVSGPGVAELIGSAPDADPPYLATRFISGPTLARRVEEQGPLPETELKELAQQLADALRLVHGAGVAHRDLKPTNVILSPEGAVIIDFGIAYATEATMLTRTGVNAGTPSWMSPEQARGDGSGPPADVFTWGALVAFAATGRHPFGAGSPDAVLYRVVHEKPTLDGVPASVMPAVEAALSKCPADRPHANDLMRLMSGPGSASGPVAGAVEAVQPPSSRRGRRWIGAAASIAAAGLIFALAQTGGTASSGPSVVRSPGGSPPHSNTLSSVSAERGLLGSVAGTYVQISGGGNDGSLTIRADGTFTLNGLPGRVEVLGPESLRFVPDVGEDFLATIRGGFLLVDFGGDGPPGTIFRLVSGSSSPSPSSPSLFGPSSFRSPAESSAVLRQISAGGDMTSAFEFASAPRAPLGSAAPRR